MTSQRAVKVGAALAGTVALAALLAAQRPPTFRTAVDIVHFGVTVVDKKGGYLTDLKEGDFEVYEDGQKQKLEFFVPCDTQIGRGAVELHLGALFDVSGSMEDDVRFARGAAIKFLNSLSEARDYTLLDFDTEVRVARYSQAEFGRMVERIRSRKTSGGYTALWDAVGVYLDGAADQEGRKILILYTDGGDNSSSITFGDLIDLLKASDVTVHAIGFLEHQPQSVRMDQRARLQQIAETTGGQAFFPVATKELDKIYAKVAAEIDAQYSMGYVSSNTRQDGAWRKVEIKVTRPGLKDIKVRTRPGYFAPLKVEKKEQEIGGRR